MSKNLLYSLLSLWLIIITSTTITHASKAFKSVHTGWNEDGVENPRRSLNMGYIWKQNKTGEVVVVDGRAFEQLRKRAGNSANERLLTEEVRKLKQNAQRHSLLRKKESTQSAINLRKQRVEVEKHVVSTRKLKVLLAKETQKLEQARKKGSVTTHRLGEEKRLLEEALGQKQKESTRTLRQRDEELKKRIASIDELKKRKEALKKRLAQETQKLTLSRKESTPCSKVKCNTLR